MHRLIVPLLLACTVAAAAPDPPAAAGGWRLATASSPYLRMHAGNPVDWHPWEAATFEKARAANKPLFISIGYFTCHWCHVMARESFENERIAALLNRAFIPVKIDREQRPDLDAAYQRYVVDTTGRGGWPLSVWTTPEGHPFLGGTYFPPEAGGGRPGFRELLAQIGTRWREDEAAVRATAGRAVERLRRTGAAVRPLEKLDDVPPADARAELERQFDEHLGGFGPAPKFPRPALLLFLLQDDAAAGADMALFTLERMAAGGIHDQLDGGFHRYSTDFEWRVPHFEKMLYDQALVARAYLAAARRSQRPQFAATAARTLDFVLAHMQDPGGGFHAALSADSLPVGERGAEPVEGAYYTWSREQLEAAVAAEDLRAWAAARYGFEAYGNAGGDPLGEFDGRNVLYVAQDLPALAAEFGVDLPTARQRTAAVDRQLRTARGRRPAVPVDDKIVTAWNGWLITTLAQAGRQLDRPEYIAAAARAADFILAELHDPRSGVLHRDWRAGVRGVPGFADDYAAMAEGLLMLYRVSGERRWLRAARRLVDTLLARFLDTAAGGFFRTTADSELWLREKPAVDGATVSANAVAVHALLDLARLTGEPRYREHARRAAAWAGARLEDSPEAMAYLLVRWPELAAAAAPADG